jgi:four helix bundle protein
MSSLFHERCLLLGVGIYKALSSAHRTRISRDILDQLVRSGASIGANANEARGAESRADFVHKMSIALKEARETGFWLAFVQLAGIATDPNIPSLRAECEERTAILIKSITTAKRNSVLAAETKP